MSNRFRYPKILEPGELGAFNDRITHLIGTPVFFSAPTDLFRPKATDAIGALYEVVSGLYTVYHDRGMKLFETYRLFCETDVPQVGFTYNDGAVRSVSYGDDNHTKMAGQIVGHERDVNDLRSGLCHGYLPGAFYSGRLKNTLNHMLTAGTWPDDLTGLTDLQAEDLLAKLTNRSDNMFAYLERCATVIARRTASTADPSDDPIADWRRTVQDAVFNGQVKQYGKRQPSDPAGTRYFDERIVKDIEDSVRPSRQRLSHEQTLQTWLQSLVAPIQNGTLTSAHLYTSLKTALTDLYFPPRPTWSSSSILSLF